MSKKTAVIDLDTGDCIDFGDHPVVRPTWYRRRLMKFFPEVTRTQQHHRDLTDINNIVSRYARTGEMPPAKQAPQYADVTALQGDLSEVAQRSREVIDNAAAYQRTRSKAAKDHKEKSIKAEAEKQLREQLKPPQKEGEK